MGNLRLSVPGWVGSLLLLVPIGLISAAVWRLAGDWGWGALAAGVLLAAWSVIMVEYRPSSVATQRPSGALRGMPRMPTGTGG